VENKSTSPLRIECLEKTHDRASFDCGNDGLNRYLKELASQELKRRTAAVFVLVHEGASRVLGYYTLSQSSVLLDDLPDRLRKRLPRYPQIPATLLGRLAVDQSCRGQGHGGLLLMNALERAWKASKEAASFAMVVDVLDIQPDPLAFYLHHEFQPLPTQPRRLFLPLQKCDELFVDNPAKEVEAAKEATVPKPQELEVSLENIGELCFAMKLFDRDGGYMGRICELNRKTPSVTYLTPSQGTHTMTLAQAKESCKRGFLLQETSDLAVQQRWKSSDDIPPTRPGLTFDDGLNLGRQQAAAYAAVVPAPYDWLYQDPEPVPLGQDDFNNGYLSGFVPTFRQLLLAKFPLKTHPAPQVEKSWRNSRWGIDPMDPAAQVAFDKGAQEAKQQQAWLPELEADRLIDQLIENLIQSGFKVAVVPFRYGFKSQMEKRFPNRY